MQSTSSEPQGSHTILPKGFSSKTYKTKRELIPRWEQTYNKVWATINKEINAVYTDVYSKLTAQMIEGMKSTHKSHDFHDELIPCQVVVIGSHLPDSKLLLSVLIKDLKDRITPYVACLWSWNCTNIKTMNFNLVSQILPLNKTGAQNENDGKEDENSSKLNLNLQITQYNLETVSAWYRTEYENISERDKKPKIVIIIPDFECYNMTILQEFIMILSTYVETLPFILIIGVATSPDALEANLSRQVLSHLVIQNFNSQYSVKIMNNIIEEILFSEKCPFRLGDKCLGYLTDNFVLNSYSVDTFVKGFRFCMMEHYYGRNSSFLCCSFDELYEKIDNMHESDIIELSRLPSFRKFIESKTLQERKLLIGDDKSIRNTIKKLMRNLLTHIKFFYYGLKILHVLSIGIPKTHIGSNIRDYYCLAVKGHLRYTEEYQNFMEMLKKLSVTELIKKLKLIIALWDMNAEVNPNSEEAKFQEVILKFNELVKQLETFRVTGDKSTCKDKSVGIYEGMKKRVFELVDEVVVRLYLRPPKDFALRELIYFDDVNAIRDKIVGSPRISTHLQLNEPGKYMKCNCCIASSCDDLPPSVPDVAIAYKIHLEHNKIINMYDWLKSFREVIMQGKNDSEEEDKNVQARFARAVSELQFLGFVKQHKKSDNLIRLTWETA